MDAAPLEDAGVVEDMGVKREEVDAALEIDASAEGDAAVDVDAAVPMASIAFVTPADGDVIGTLPFAVSAQLSPSDVLGALRLELDGALLAEVASGSEISASIDTLTLGAHVLRASAIDSGGHASEATVNVMRPSAPPEVLLRSPRTGTATPSQRVRITGAASDDVAVTSLVWSANGGAHVPVALAADGSFALELSAAPGANVIVLTATDAEGQTDSATSTVHFGHRLSVGNSQGALIYEGVLHTWGRNELGQLGNATLNGSAYGDCAAASLPVRYEPTGASGLVSIVTRQTFMIALRDDGSVLTWGSNSDGQLGYAAELDCGSAGASPCRRLPTVVPGISGAIAVAAGFNHSLVLLSDGTVMSFGQNTRGQLGYATPSDADQTTPTAVPGLADIVQLAAGSTHSLALTRGGQVYVWGDNQYGVLADGTADTTVHAVPTLVAGLADVVALASSNSTVLALRADGTLVAWGRNNNGQIGNGASGATNVTAPTPVLVSLAGGGDPAVALTSVESIAGDGFVSLAVTTNGDVYTWGLGSLGQLGLGTLPDGSRDLANRALATRVVPPGSAADFVVLEAEVGAGGPAFALTTTRNVLGWGWSFQGSLGLAAAINAWAYTSPVLIYPIP
jgi:alpha-tubulin suppressor-like RCC1 family protein